MSLGYPDKILPYPAIEYIPLTINNKSLNQNWDNNYQNKLYVFDNLQQAKGTLRFYNLDYHPNFKLNNQLLLLLLNGKVEEIYYRAYNVQLIGKNISNSYHLFTIPQQYFYKDKLIFNFYLPTGDKISKKRYQLG